MLETPPRSSGLEASLEKLNLKKSNSISIPDTIGHVRRAFGELLSTSPSSLILGNDDAEAEAKMWDCFAEVFQSEMELRLDSDGSEPSKEVQRQVLADILVWAEITQEHYDDSTASFITQPHQGDDSFQRIGSALRQAKQARGL